MLNEDYSGIDTLISEKIETAINTKIKNYKKNCKFFLYGFIGFVLLIVSFGLFGGGDFLIAIHNKIFLPPEFGTSAEDSFPAISYEATFELTSKTTEQQKALRFYASKGQRVEAYFKIIYGNNIPVSDGKNTPVVITVDGNFIDTKEGAGFYDITKDIDCDRKFIGKKNIHTIVFSLLDTVELTDLEVTIICLVLVKHKVKK